VNMTQFTIVLLRRPADAPDLSEGELDELQERHVAYQGRMRELGHLLVAGPFEAQPHESRTGLEETRRLAAEDPSVQAGRLAVDVWTWWVPAGVLAQP
jgi:uncharacterized protein